MEVVRKRGENQRWRRGRRKTGRRRSREDIPPRGWSSGRINGMRFWNFVLFCATGHFNRRISRSALVPAARILQWHFQKANKSNISIEFPSHFGLLTATRIYIGISCVSLHPLLQRKYIDTKSRIWSCNIYIDSKER